MIISPETAIEGGWIRGIANQELQVQPNAIDFTLDQAYSVKSGPFIMAINTIDGKEEKCMRGGDQLVVQSHPFNSKFADGANTWIIKGHGMIDCLSNMYVEVPDDVAVMLIPRSSIARNGIILTCGLYDTGFKGHLGFMLHNRHDEAAYIGPGVRVGQCMFISADSVGQYAGGWNHEQGTHTPNLC